MIDTTGYKPQAWEEIADHICRIHPPDTAINALKEKHSDSVPLVESLKADADRQWDMFVYACRMLADRNRLIEDLNKEADRLTAEIEENGDLIYELGKLKSK